MNLYGYLFKCHRLIMHNPATFTRYLLLYPNLYNILCQFGIGWNSICKVVYYKCRHSFIWFLGRAKKLNCRRVKKLIMNSFQKYALKIGFNKQNVNIKYIRTANGNRKKRGTGNKDLAFQSWNEEYLINHQQYAFKCRADAFRWPYLWNGPAGCLHV